MCVCARCAKGVCLRGRDLLAATHTLKYAYTSASTSINAPWTKGSPCKVYKQKLRQENMGKELGWGNNRFVPPGQPLCIHDYGSTDTNSAHSHLHAEPCAKAANKRHTHPHLFTSTAACTQACRQSHTRTDTHACARTCAHAHTQRHPASALAACVRGVGCASTRTIPSRPPAAPPQKHASIPRAHRTPRSGASGSLCPAGGARQPCECKVMIGRWFLSVAGGKGKGSGGVAGG